MAGGFPLGRIRRGRSALRLCAEDLDEGVENPRKRTLSAADIDELPFECRFDDASHLKRQFVVDLCATMVGRTVISALSDTSFKVGASASTSICGVI